MPVLKPIEIEKQNGFRSNLSFISLARIVIIFIILFYHREIERRGPSLVETVRIIIFGQVWNKIITELSTVCQVEGMLSDGNIANISIGVWYTTMLTIYASHCIAINYFCWNTSITSFPFRSWIWMAFQSASPYSTVTFSASLNTIRIAI